jgi:hypothetical protein
MENDKPDTSELTPGTLVNCPTCGLPAEIADRFTLGGAPGPVQHVKMVCTRRHWYTLPIDTLPVNRPARDQADGSSIAHRR